jgi:transcriptional regulator with XRE-family HTH domain
MKGIYFEEKGLALLEQRGMTKAEFARRMGIQRQNVNVLFRTNNLETIAHAAEILEVPFALLVSYVEDPDVFDLPIPESSVIEQGNDCLLICPEDVPVGDSVEDMRTRQELIKQFYFYWKTQNPELRRFNVDLGENIYINHTSLVETAGRASLTYYSTLAVLQLDAILQNAKVCFVDKPKAGNKQQSKFERMLGMRYSCPGIGEVQLMVGVRKRDKTKIQYCITALTPILRIKEKSSRK